MSQEQLRVAVAQFPGSNDIVQNKQYILDLSRQAAEAKAELVVFPEAGR